MDSVEHAIRLAAMGFNVFPCRQGDKRPAVEDFTGRATHKLPDVRTLWHETTARALRNGYGTDFNIGIATTKFYDDQALVVVDVDKKDGRNGFDSLEILEMCDYELPRTLCQQTPTGGMHHIFFTDQPVKQGTNVLGKGLDIRAKGGYIVAPGSTIHGVPYRFTNTVDQAVVRAPQWVIDKCGLWLPPPTTLSLVTEEDVEQGRAVVQAMKYLRTVPIITQGGRDNECYKIAGRIKDMGVRRETIMQLLADSTIFHPPLTAWEVESVVNHVFQYGKTPPGALSLEAQFGKPEPDEVPAQKPSRITTAKSLSKKPKKATPPLIEGLLNPGGFSALVGVSGTKKSFVALDMAFSIATGRNCLGRKTQPGGALYMALEGLTGFENRVRALKQHYELEDFPLAISGESINLADTASKDGEKLLELIKEAEQALGQPIKFLVLDTLNRVMAGADENSTRDMTFIVGVLDTVRKRTGVHIMLVHHLGKDTKKGARGSSVLNAALDTELRVVNDCVHPFKQKDMELGPKIPFRLENVELEDEQGTKIKTCVLASASQAHVSFVQKPIPLDSNEEKLLEVLKQSATTLLPDALRPAFMETGQRVTEKIILRDLFIKKHFDDKPKQTRSSAFKRALDWLVENNHAHCHGDFVWPEKEKNE